MQIVRNDCRSAVYHMFECCHFRHVCQGTHENPELIWNDEAREKVCSTVRQMKDEYVP